MKRLLITATLILAASAVPSLGRAGEVLAAHEQPVADVLQAMGEPPIGQLPSAEQVFRFLWLRSFHRPILVQLVKHGTTLSLLYKALDRPWSVDPEGVHVGKLIEEHRTSIPPEAWDRLADMRRSVFWGRPSSDPAALTGVDGAMWILEGRSWDQYHIVERWSPKSGVFRAMCLEMLGLAGLDLSNDRVY